MPHAINNALRNNAILQVKIRTDDCLLADHGLDEVHAERVDDCRTADGRLEIRSPLVGKAVWYRLRRLIEIGGHDKGLRLERVFPYSRILIARMPRTHLTGHIPRRHAFTGITPVSWPAGCVDFLAL